jgi:SMC interacting uncharacterized protein involved in chromosome segregation
MEEELNYLSEKIEDIEHRVNMCDFAIDQGIKVAEEKEELEKEINILNCILNYIALIEMQQ